MGWDKRYQSLLPWGGGDQCCLHDAVYMMIHCIPGVDLKDKKLLFRSYHSLTCSIFSTSRYQVYTVEKYRDYSTSSILERDHAHVGSCGVA
jgi:hypothetical protein